MKYYYSSFNNKTFLDQRNYFFKKIINFKNTKKKIDSLHLYTWTKKDLKFIVKNYKKIKKIIAIHVLHSGSLTGDIKYNNYIFVKLFNFIFNIKLTFKIFLLGILNKKIIFKDIKSFYLIISSKNINKKILPFNPEIFGQMQPIIKKKIIYKDIFKKKLSLKNKICLIDSHFPLHPDSYSQNLLNNKIAPILIGNYLDFLNRKINLKNKYLLIFLHPRTYEIIKKNNRLKNLLKKYYNKFIFLNGLNSFFTLYKKLTIKSKKIYVQPGTQLSALKFFYKINKNKIEILKFDKQFLLNFKLLKKNYNSNYLQNYEKIEINQFKFLNKNKFFDYS